ncbi:MAG: spermine synthase [Oceanospirillaceae bacterium]|nr:spermine synthase [Oceanospirillaceae bacterium]
MSAGVEVFLARDEYGVIRVLDDGERRILSFGGDDEQSCALRSEPWRLQHEYTRAMVLVLLFCQPRRVLSLGLGAGSLNTLLHRSIPGLKQHVVELRPSVVEAARGFFGLPDGKRLTVEVGDAGCYLDGPPERRVDLLFSDLYGPEGMDDQQITERFVERCQVHLKDDGWLVLNCWREHQDSDLINVLSGGFSEIYGCQTPDGNWILYAGNGPVQLGSRGIRKQLRELEQQLGFSLSATFKRIRAILHSGD